MYRTVILVVSLSLFSVLAYQMRPTPTPAEELQKNFITCLEDNLTNTHNDCLAMVTKRK